MLVLIMVWRRFSFGVVVVLLRQFNEAFVNQNDVPVPLLRFLSTGTNVLLYDVVQLIKNVARLSIHSIHFLQLRKKALEFVSVDLYTKVKPIYKDRRFNNQIFV